MRGHYKILIPTIVSAAVLPLAAHAQSLSDWSLPEPEKTASPTVQGPVDAQNPSVRPAQPQAGPTAQPSASTAPTPVPIITPPPPQANATSAPTSRPTAGAATAPTRTEQARAPETASPAPTASPTVTATAAASSPEPVASEMPEQASPAPETVEAPAAPDEATWSPWWWALPIAIVALVLLVFLRRRRTAPPEQVSARVAASPQPKPAPAPLPTPEAEPVPAPRPAASPEPVSVTLEPVMMRLSLFYATLQYRLTVTSSERRAALNISGDLSSAHASLSRDDQLAPAPESLAQLHTLPELAPNEPLELKGEVQLPLGAIRALRRGGGAFFVPLVRFCLIGEDGTALRRVFTLGIPGSSAGLAPLRIDAGPRNFEPLAAREIEAARELPLNIGSLPLDPKRAAG